MKKANVNFLLISALLFLLFSFVVELSEIGEFINELLFRHATNVAMDTCISVVRITFG